MRTIGTRLFPAVGLAALVAALTLAGPPPGNAVPPAHEVLVVNTPAQPVPTSAQGTTAVAGIVGIDPSNNTVQLNSTAPLLVRDVDNPASQPFQKTTSTVQSGTNVSTLTLATVPAGKRLVIEFISASGQVPLGQHVESWGVLTVAPPTGGAQHELLVTAQPPAVIGDALFRTSQQVRLYADPGTSVQTIIRRNSGAGSATFLMTVSGHLVDVP
jgi:hypothetical protein